jgi:peptide/nickel transport system ATP-binding protein
VTADRLEFDGIDLNLPRAPHARPARRRIAMVMQDPKFAEPGDDHRPPDRRGLRLHTRTGAARPARKALEMLAAVQIRDPERVFDAYPHEVSGGMGQRAMIAMMLAPTRPADRRRADLGARRHRPARGAGDPRPIWCASAAWG